MKARYHYARKTGYDGTENEQGDVEEIWHRGMIAETRGISPAGLPLRTISGNYSRVTQAVHTGPVIASLVPQCSPVLSTHQ